jgi:hypothetical protein
MAESDARTADLTFDDGVLWAVARIVDCYDEITMAAWLLRESGVDTTRVEDVDAPFIAKALEK